MAAFRQGDAARHADVGLHHGDAKQVYVAARYGEVFGTQDGGESWLEMPLPQGVQHVYALACG